MPARSEANAMVLAHVPQNLPAALPDAADFVRICVDEVRDEVVRGETDRLCAIRAQVPRIA
jgi:hypothetical protein